MTHTLKEMYVKKAAPALREKFGYASPMAVPRIEKVVVNCGVGRLREKDQQEEVNKYLSLITGQKPSPRPARSSIASFKTRQGQVVGYKVTLRGKRMYDFLTRLVMAALPRTRDFRGLKGSAIHEGGALTIGIKEHIVFPETIGEDTRTPFGMEVTVVSNAQTRAEAEELFRLLGFPLEHTHG